MFAMSSQHSQRNWLHVASTLILLSTGFIVVPFSTWWYLPSVLWWFFHSLTHSVSNIWMICIAVVLSFQMAILWSLPVGLLLIITVLLLWSLESIMSVRQRSIRWSLEILHGFLVVGVFLGLSQSITISRLLFNCLAILVVMGVLIVMGQMHEK